CFVIPSEDERERGRRGTLRLGSRGNHEPVGRRSLRRAVHGVRDDIRVLSSRARTSASEDDEGPFVLALVVTTSPWAEGPSAVLCTAFGMTSVFCHPERGRARARTTRDPSSCLSWPPRTPWSEGPSG